ncbi:MAG: DUF4397 domain-containing protein [Woeseiaceae bacterium]
MRPFLYLVACAAMLAVGGCAKESDRPVATGKASVRAINAIPASPQISFLIEQRALGNIAYKATSTTARYDDLSYTFYFKALLAGDTAQTVVASFPLDVVADMDYTFIIGGTLAAPTITLWSEPEQVFTGDENYLSLRIAHTAVSLGDVDVYLLPPGTAPVLGQALGTLSYGEYLPPMDVDEGDYVLTYTAAGDPATVLFESRTLTLVSKTSKILTIFDSDENDVAPWSVRIMDLAAGSSSLVADANYPPTVRFLQASINFPDADIYDTDPLTAPIVTGHTFRDITGDIPMPSGTVPITYTTAGDTSMLLIDENHDIAAGTHQQYVVTNVDGTDTIIPSLPDRRSISTLARLSLVNTASNVGAVDIYLVPAGDSIDDANPALFSLTVGLTPVQFSVNAKDFDIYVTAPGEKTVIAGPIPLTTQLGGVYDAILYDTTDPTAVDFEFIPPP